MIPEYKLEEKYEKLLRIRTSGRDDSHSDAYRFPYEPTPYCVLERLGNSGWIRKKNLLLDYGCGKGRVGLYLSYQTRCSAIGIEYDERIYEKAEENRVQAAAGSRVTFLLTDASRYEVPANADRMYFFNPFSVEILQGVIGNILDSFYENPREILLFFYFPSDEYISYLMTVPELEFADEISCDDLFDQEKDRERIVIFEITG